MLVAGSRGTRWTRGGPRSQRRTWDIRTKRRARSLRSSRRTGQDNLSRHLVHSVSLLTKHCVFLWCMLTCTYWVILITRAGWRRSSRNPGSFRSARVWGENSIITVKFNFLCRVRLCAHSLCLDFLSGVWWRDGTAGSSRSSRRSCKYQYLFHFLFLV